MQGFGLFSISFSGLASVIAGADWYDVADGPTQIIYMQFCPF